MWILRDEVGSHPRMQSELNLLTAIQDCVYDPRGFRSPDETVPRDPPLFRKAANRSRPAENLWQFLPESRTVRVRASGEWSP